MTKASVHLRVADGTFWRAHHASGISKPTTCVPCIARPQQIRLSTGQSEDSPYPAPTLGATIVVAWRILRNVSLPTNVCIARAATLYSATAFGADLQIAFISSHTATSSIATAMSRLRLHIPLPSKSYRHPAESEHPPISQAHSQDRPFTRRPSQRRNHTSDIWAKAIGS
jgi:hypothetical protein